MGKSSYWELLKDPRWQRKRLEILERDNWACLDCEAKDKTLHVHHRYYTKGAKPWEYEDDALQTLCDVCHKEITEDMARAKVALERLPHGDVKQAIGYMEALYALSEVVPIAVNSHDEAEGAADAIPDRGRRSIVMSIVHAAMAHPDHLVNIIDYEIDVAQAVAKVPVES